MVADRSKTIDDAKEIIEYVLKYFCENYSGYDYQFVISNSNFKVVGYSSNG